MGALVVAFASRTAAARADDCVPRPVVRVEVQADEDHPGVSKRVTDVVMSELSNANRCRSPPAVGPPAVVSIGWPRADVARIKITVAFPDGRTEEATRDVDLSSVNEEGEPLAIAIQVDEMLGALVASMPKPAPPLPLLPAAAPKRVPPADRGAQEPERRLTVATTLSLSKTTSGLVLLAAGGALGVVVIPNLEVAVEGALGHTWETRAKTGAERAGILGARIWLGSSTARTVGISAGLGMAWLGVRGESTGLLLIAGRVFWQPSTPVRLVVALDTDPLTREAALRFSAQLGVEARF